MHHLTAKSLLAATAVAALALPGAAQARHGADDPAGHVRHARHAVRHHQDRRGDDGVARHARHGADDGPNHG